MSEKKHIYKIRSYVNASHAIRWESGIGKEHIHTWEVACEITTVNNHMVIFEDLELVLKGVFSKYSGKFLNEIEPFNELNPTVENVAEHLFDEISKKLGEIEASLIRIEVGESPTRLYCISINENN